MYFVSHFVQQLIHNFNYSSTVQPFRGFLRHSPYENRKHFNFTFLVLFNNVLIFFDDLLTHTGYLNLIFHQHPSLSLDNLQSTQLKSNTLHFSVMSPSQVLHNLLALPWTATLRLSVCRSFHLV